MNQSVLTDRTIKKMIKSQEKKQEILNYMKIHNPELLSNPHRRQRIRDCCNVLRFINFGNGKSKLYRANFCKYDKFCLACSTRRAIKSIQKFIDGIQTNGLQAKNWYHITLTIRHDKSQSLEYSMDRIMSYKKAIAMAVRNSKRPNQIKQSFFSQFDGMASSVEITYSEKSWWHPHIHALVCTDSDVEIEYFDKLRAKSNRSLIKERYALTKDSYCVAMRKVDVSKNNFDRQGIAEVFKYAIKFSSLSIPRLVELIALQKKKQYRFYATTGIFRWWKNSQQKDRKELSQWEIKELSNVIYSDHIFNKEMNLYDIWSPIMTC